MAKRIGGKGPTGAQKPKGRNMNYEPAAFQQRGDANASRSGKATGKVVGGNATPPAVDPAGGMHIGTQMHGGINKAATTKLPSTQSKSD